MSHRQESSQPLTLIEKNQPLEEQWLYRPGWAVETFEQLERQAEQAEHMIGLYGVTVWLWTSTSGAHLSKARWRDVQQYFELEHTTNNPFHYTLIFKKPLTIDQVDSFNTLFSRHSSS